MFDEKCVYVNTMHAYFYQLANTVLYNGQMSGDKFLRKYDYILRELLEFVKDDESLELVRKMCLSDCNLSWDYVLIDEAQDWSTLEREVILKLFDGGRIIVADGGQQFVRRIDTCDWSVIRERNNIKLKYCLRQKENLVSFINSYSHKADILGGKVLTKNNMLGGKIIITDDDHLYEIHAQEIKRLQNTGNIAYYMLYLVPHSLVKKTTCGSQFELRSQFEQNGIYYWDGTSANNRDGDSVNADEVRLLQYDSARGLEGWTVMCLDFDVFLDEKDSEYVDGKWIPSCWKALRKEEKSIYIIGQ